VRPEPTEPEQLALTGLPEPLFAATPSRLLAFDCPRRYWFTYLARPAPPKGAPWAHNTVGAVVHVALARWWQQPLRRRTPEAGADLVRRFWQSDGFADDNQSAGWREQAARWVQNYVADPRSGMSPESPPAGVERTVRVVTERLAVSGRADRIDRRPRPDSGPATGSPDELVVVDYKSGRHPLRDRDAAESLALALYALAAAGTLHQHCRRVELHHLPTGDVLGFEHSDASLQAHVARAESAADGIRDAERQLDAGLDSEQAFRPAPGPSCTWCDYRRLCPAGQRASEYRPSWGGLGELTGEV